VDRRASLFFPRRVADTLTFAIGSCPWLSSGAASGVAGASTPP